MHNNTHDYNAHAKQSCIKSMLSAMKASTLQLTTLCCIHKSMHATMQPYERCCRVTTLPPCYTTLPCKSMYYDDDLLTDPQFVIQTNMGSPPVENNTAASVQARSQPPKEKARCEEVLERPERALGHAVDLYMTILPGKQ